LKFRSLALSTSVADFIRSFILSREISPDKINKLIYIRKKH